MTRKLTCFNMETATRLHILIFVLMRINHYSTREKQSAILGKTYWGKQEQKKLISSRYLLSDLRERRCGQMLLDTWFKFFHLMSFF